MSYKPGDIAKSIESFNTTRRICIHIKNGEILVFYYHPPKDDKCEKILHKFTISGKIIEPYFEVYCVVIHPDYEHYIKNCYFKSHMLVYVDIKPVNYSEINQLADTNSIVFNSDKITQDILEYTNNRKIRFQIHGELIDIEILKAIKGRLFGYDCDKIHGPEYFPLFPPTEGLDIKVSHKDVDELCKYLPCILYLTLYLSDLDNDDVIKCMNSCNNLIDFKIHISDPILLEQVPPSLRFITLNSDTPTNIDHLTKTSNIKYYLGNIVYTNLPSGVYVDKK